MAEEQPPPQPPTQPHDQPGTRDPPASTVDVSFDNDDDLDSFLLNSSARQSLTVITPPEDERGDRSDQAPDVVDVAAAVDFSAVAALLGSIGGGPLEARHLEEILRPYSTAIVALASKVAEKGSARDKRSSERQTHTPAMDAGAGTPASASAATAADRDGAADGFAAWRTDMEARFAVQQQAVSDLVASLTVRCAHRSDLSRPACVCPTPRRRRGYRPNCSGSHIRRRRLARRGSPSRCATGTTLTCSSLSKAGGRSWCARRRHSAM
mmetsp:Transcript_16553/g.49700  ORF Transcript_16553/g.49700 Transcript_16553/m.49700 type:complete len:267 (+) Transcript_16553:23-823(+)